MRQNNHCAMALFLEHLLALSLILMVAPQTLSAKDVASVSGPRIVFAENEYHFGEVVRGDVVEHVFEFVNEGDATLFIKDVLSSCGCTGALMSSDTIKPGEKGEVRVSYNSEGRVGLVKRDITVITNDENNPEVVLKITADVLPGNSTHGKPMGNSGLSLFSHRCNRCHGEPAENLYGEKLYQAVCTFCHAYDEQASRAATYDQMQKLPKEKLIMVISHGVTDTEMPAFINTENGPLDTKQIESVADYIMRGE